MLLDLVGLSVNEPDEEGELPLCAAASNGHANVILKLFRDYRVNVLLARTEDGNTALICAAEARELGATKALLECGRLLPVGPGGRTWPPEAALRCAHACTAMPDGSAPTDLALSALSRRCEWRTTISRQWTQTTTRTPGPTP